MNEIVIPWNMANNFIECKKVREYEIKNYEIVGYKYITDSKWDKIIDVSPPSPSSSPKSGGNLKEKMGLSL